MRRSSAAPAFLGLLLAGLLAVGSTARAENPCLPDASAVADAAFGDDSGIGGTGYTGGDSGIGGTGIYGTITGFASICVNGLRIRYDDAAAVEINGERSGIADLALGQLVWVEAFAAERGLWAEKISVFSAAIGRIEALDAQDRHLEVSGEAIEVPGEAIVLDISGRRVTDLSELSVGDLVDVSGLRHPDGHIVATRIAETTGTAREDVGVPDLGELLAEAPDLLRVSIEGFLHDREGSGELRIDGLAIDTSALAKLGELDPERRVWLSAARTPDRALRAHSITVRPLLPPEPPDPSTAAAPRSLGASDLPGLTRPGERASAPDARARVPGLAPPGEREPPHLLLDPSSLGRPQVPKPAPLPVGLERSELPIPQEPIDGPSRLDQVQTGAE